MEVNAPGAAEARTVLTDPPSVHSLIMIVLCMYDDAPGADHLSAEAQHIIVNKANEYFRHFYGENIAPDLTDFDAYQRLINAYTAKVTELTNEPKLYFNGGPMVFIPVPRNEAWNNAAIVYMSNGHRNPNPAFWEDWNPSDHAYFFTGLPPERLGGVVLDDILGKNLEDFTVPDPEDFTVPDPEDFTVPDPDAGAGGPGGAGAGGPGGGAGAWGAGAWGAGGPGGAGAAGGPGGGAGAWGAGGPGGAGAWGAGGPGGAGAWGAGGPGGAGAWGAGGPGGGPGGGAGAGGPGGAGAGGPGGAGAAANEMQFGGRRRKTGRAHRKRRSHTSRRLRKRRQTRRGRKN